MESIKPTLRKLLIEEEDKKKGSEEYQRTLADLDVALFGLTVLGEKLQRMMEQEGMALNAPADIPRIVVNAQNDLKKAQEKINNIGELMGYLDKVIT